MSNGSRNQLQMNDCGFMTEEKNREFRVQQLLNDKKWHLFIKRTWIFRHIPFIEFVFGSGSLAVGNVDEESDFDVLIGVRTGRIFTARFCAALALGLFGWRRAKEHGNAAAANKVCLNHFVTEASYRLRLPVNPYWKLLYKRLVPVYGMRENIQEFYDANSDWVGKRILESDLRYDPSRDSKMKKFFEAFLGGRIGNWCELRLKQYQRHRIQRGMQAHNDSHNMAHEMWIIGAGESARVELAPLIVYSDEELEFHPDPAVIEIR